jgi:hypothetical protein
MSGGGGTSGTGGTATEPPPVSCATGLAERVSVTSIAVSPDVETEGSGINSISLPVILATAPGGSAKVAWSDGENAHITPLDAANQRAGDDIVLAGEEVRGFVAHDDGAAILVRRGDEMVFVRVDNAGAEQASLSIVGTEEHNVDGSRWIDDWPHQGRLAWSGTEYAAYFGQTGNHGSAGDHQGDHYALISPSGERSDGGWDWGCSHSLDDRIAHNGEDFAPVCISDTYPGAGIFLNNRTELSEEPSVTNVGGIAKLGGLVPAPDGFWFTFTTPEDRASVDIAFFHFTSDGTVSGRTYLTDTADIDEGYSHLAAYGDGLLAGWDADDTFTLAMLDTAGAIVEGPVAVDAQIGGQDDFATFANGDAGWAGAWDDLGAIKVVRVARCTE